MKKIFLALALAALVFTAPAQAQPQAKEIAFARPCPDGVPVYNKSTDKVACGALAQSGSGYVIEMASVPNQPASCPQGFDFIGNLDKASLAQRGMNSNGNVQHYACVKQ